MVMVKGVFVGVRVCMCVCVYVCMCTCRTLKVSIMSPLVARKRCQQYPRPLWCFLLLKHCFIIKQKGIDVSNQIGDLPAIHSSDWSWIAPVVSPPASVQATLPAPASVQATLPAPASVQNTLPAPASVQVTLPAPARVPALLPAASGMGMPPASRGM